MHYRLADYVLWLLTPSLQAGVLLAMYRRGLNRRYPLFLAYTMLQVASAVILAFLAATSYTGYYYAYWCNLVLSIVISFFVLWEIVKRALRRPRSKGVRLFPVLCAVVLLIAALELCLTRGPLSGEFVTSSMMLSDRSLRLLQTVLFLVLIFFSKALRLSRKSITFGLALGFGLFAIVNILVATTLSQHGFLTSLALSKINSVAYVIAALIWLGYVIFGFEDESGRKRASFLLLPDDDGQRRLKPPSRWFFREDLLHGSVAARG
jgi:hypothetical protein